VFAPTTTSGLFRVPSSGGEAVPLTRLAPSDRSHRWPSFLPDGKAVLFARQQQNASYDDSTIEAVRLDSGATKVLVRGGTFPHYLSTGHLVYMRESTLFAVPFNAATLEVTGDPQPILGGILSSSGVGSGGGDGASQVSFAANGTMAYLSGTVTKDDTQLTIVDRTGKVSYTFPEQRRFKSPHFSSDGRRIAAEVDDGNTSNVYVIEPETNRFSRVTFLGPINGSPCWSPDGRRIAYFGSGAGGLVGLAITRSDGTGNPELLSNDRTIRIPTGFSPDGRTLLAIEQTAAGDFDVITLDVADKRRTPLVASPANEIGPVFSPDGRWIAYQSNESGRDEVYVRSFPAAEGKWQISTEGGQSPTWSKAGREIVYISGTASATRFMAADVSVQDGAIRASRPHRLFESSIARPPTASIYDTSADGSRFVFLKRVDSTAATEHSPVTIVVNVFDEVRRAFSAPSVR
jgi:serine/threonine-protein kinase